MQNLLRSVILLLCMSSGIASAAEGETSSEVLIGYVGSLNEQDAANARNAAQMAIDEENAVTTYIGKTKVHFKLLEQNDKADPQTAQYVASYLSKTNVAAVIGHWTSTTSILAAPIYAEAGIAQIAPLAWSYLYTLAEGKSHFQGVGNDAIAMRYVIDYLATNMQVKRIMVIDDSALLGTSMADSFEKYAKTVGITTLRQSVSTQTSDFNQPLTIAKQFQPDFIFFTGRFIQSTSLARNIKRLGIPAKLLLTGSVVTPDFLAGIDYDNTSGEIYAIVPGAPVENSTKIQNFRKRYVSQFKIEPMPLSTFTYDSVRTLISAIRKADSLDRKQIIAALYEISYQGLNGQISFNRDGSLKNPNYILYQTEKLKWVVRKVMK